MKIPVSPKKTDGKLTYYAHVKADNLVTWAVSAMKNSYSPYSGHKEGVLIRTERGDIAVGTNVETINYDGLVAIEVAIGRLFVQQPWVDHASEPEKISDVIYALEDFDPQDPNSYVPCGKSLDWLRKFGSPDTVLHFATPEKGILVSRVLNDLLPYGPKMKGLKEYLDGTHDFHNHIHNHQEKPEDISAQVWHSLRKSRLFAFAPYSNYRVGVALEADARPLPEEALNEIKRVFQVAALSDEQQNALLQSLQRGVDRHEGVNVEVSGNAGLHGEGCAIGSMITDHGPQAKIRRLYLQGGFSHGSHDCSPCGKCRQLINEFSTAATEIIVVAEDGALPVIPEKQLLPGVFKFEAKIT